MLQENPEFGGFGASCFHSLGSVLAPGLGSGLGCYKVSSACWGSRLGPYMRVFSLCLISLLGFLYFFSSAAVCQRLGQREGSGCDGLCSVLGSKKAFFGDAAHQWRVQDLAADLPGVCCGCVGAISTGREVVEKAVHFVQRSAWVNLSSR